jgi:hypothetical protein
LSLVGIAANVLDVAIVLLQLSLKTELELEGYQVSGMEHSDIKGLPHVPDIDMETKAVVCGLDRYDNEAGIVLTQAIWLTLLAL